MPSLAQGIGRGMQTGASILNFLSAQERQRLMDERTGLLNELTRERIADIQSTRKLLEQTTFQEGMEEIAGEHQAAATGVNLRDLLRGGGATKEQAGLAELGYYEGGKIPSQAYGMIAPETGQKPTATARNRADTYQRFKKWYVETHGATSEEEIRKAWRKKEFDEKAKGTKKKEPSLKELEGALEHAKSFADWQQNPEDIKRLEDAIKQKKSAVTLGLRRGKVAVTKRRFTPAEGIPGMEPFQPSGTTKEEDEFVAEARGREDKIDWKKIAAKHPKWNIFYIKQKLGLNE